MKPPLKTIDLNADVWRWQVFPFVFWGSAEEQSQSLFEGECDNEAAMRAAIVMCGVQITPRRFYDPQRYYLNGERVFVRFTRLSDGARVTEYGPEKELRISPANEWSRD